MRLHRKGTIYDIDFTTSTLTHKPNYPKDQCIDSDYYHYPLHFLMAMVMVLVVVVKTRSRNKLLGKHQFSVGQAKLGLWTRAIFRVCLVVLPLWLSTYALAVVLQGNFSNPKTLLITSWTETHMVFISIRVCNVVTMFQHFALPLQETTNHIFICPRYAKNVINDIPNRWITLWVWWIHMFLFWHLSNRYITPKNPEMVYNLWVFMSLEHSSTLK